MLTEIIRRIREAGTPFEQRIFGVASLDAAFDKAPAVPMPWAAVLLLGETTGPNRGDWDVTQTITQQIGVVVCLDNRADPRGQTATEQALSSEMALEHPHAVINARKALWYALLAWAPTSCDDAMTYAGSRHLRMDRGRLWHLFIFESIHALDATSAQQDPTNGDGSLVPFLRFYPDYGIPRTPPEHDTILASDQITVPGATY